MAKIERFIDDRNEWSTAQHFHFMATGEKPENPEYLEARAEALEDAGLEPDADEGLKPHAERSVEEEVQSLRNTKEKQA